MLLIKLLLNPLVLIKVGAKKGLAYEYVPTRFIGCTDLVKGQKSWASK
jgi:hypothetical protein